MRSFSKVKRIAIKIGTNTLTRDGRTDPAFIRRISRQIAGLKQEGREIVIVSSGAIGLGVTSLGLTERPSGIVLRQACAAIGQPLLMGEYARAFGRQGITTAQVLLTADVLHNRKTYLNLRNSIEALLKLGVIPIVNENDNVSTAEIGSAFGDNDQLSALVASKIDADLLIILSDIDALYDSDPRKNPQAKRVDTVFAITNEIVSAAGEAGSRFATGGMKTKLQAAQMAARAGCRVVSANGRAPNVIGRIMAGRIVGTVFLPRERLSNRERWLLHTTVAGRIQVDEGALEAIRNHKSLLPSGITAVQGHFDAGSVVMINGAGGHTAAKAISNLSSEELATVIGKHSSEIRRLLGSHRRDVVATPEDIIFLDY